VNVREEFNFSGDLPWLRLLFDPSKMGGWMRLVYKSSFFEPTIRPILRISTPGGHRDDFMPPAYLGRGIWTGLIPNDCDGMFVSPPTSANNITFEVDTLQKIPLRRVYAAAMLGSVEKTLSHLGSHLRGRYDESREELEYAVKHTSFGHYDRWRRKRLRKLDIGGIDRSLYDWKVVAPIRLLVDMRGRNLSTLQPLLKSLSAQPFPHWSLLAIGAAEGDPSQFGTDRRLRIMSAMATLSEATADLPPEALIGRCDSADRIPDFALATLADFAHANMSVDVVYGDEDCVGFDGIFRDPLLKPDWSPLFEANGGYIGAAVFVRASILRRNDKPAVNFANRRAGVQRSVDINTAKVAHFRRLLLSRAEPSWQRPAEMSSGPVINTISQSLITNGLVKSLQATIIIPTRDRIDLLKPCLESLLALKTAVECEIIVVDNGSVRRETLEFLGALTNLENVSVLRRPGPFNFSALNNDAASHARGSVLIFLNNDTVSQRGDWITPLLDFARRPNTGAAGGHLFYRSGRLQHAGVVVGLLGRAGHVGGKLPGKEPGYLRMFATARETSAVTGACMAVRKAIFLEAGGFDAANLPVDLNDIDLCLRLGERGYANVYVPDAELDHYESESRRDRTPMKIKYRREWSFFQARWRDAMRDDPYFHPVLSRFSSVPALE
jgi:GT2 family glycosyltransferase